MRIIGNSFHATEKGKQVLDFGAHRVHGTVNETHLGSKSKSFPLLQQIVSPPLAAPPRSTWGVSAQTWASLLYLFSRATHPPLSPHGELQRPSGDHQSADRQQDPRSCQTQGWLSVTEDHGLCKPLRHSTIHAGTLCLHPFCLAWKGDVVKKKKGGMGGGGWKPKKKEKKHT